MFPSLSGKTFIRTVFCKISRQPAWHGVSIPFREDLHSDEDEIEEAARELRIGFHPFQGRPSFGPERGADIMDRKQFAFPSLSGKTFIRTNEVFGSQFYYRPPVSIPFREDLHSDMCRSFVRSSLSFGRFHPFQGRPSFGQAVIEGYSPRRRQQFPSLSGKTFIRTAEVL